MPLVEHLRELRGRLVKSVVAIAAGAVVGFAFYDRIFDFLKAPACDIKADITPIHEGDCGVLTVSGLLNPFSLQLKVSLIAGLIIASPVWLYQLWAFVAPGLHKREKRWSLAFVGTGVPLFLAGALAVYWIMPKAVGILLSFTPEDVANNVFLTEYLDFVLRMILVFGLAFELPLILAILSLAGVVDAPKLRSWWRVAIFVIFVFAAIATPTGDPLTMTTLAAPMIFLYFGSVGFAMIVDRRRSRAGSPGDWSDDQASPLDATPSRIDESPAPVDAPAPVDSSGGPPTRDPSGQDPTDIT
jgi:sec-independent protein translocase protein TatC